ncbi:hypothetical protein ACI3KS_17845 [Microbacterium sp. ZW T5_45]|uniref:hypothetical protein n=1 Tax=Microbacterium sp. ZW T5_45 TaxID=3378080 RepID=UPI003853FC3D
MTTWRVASDLAAIMVPIGTGGAVLAVLCALVAGFAIARGAGGLTGGAVGIWIPAAMVSSMAGFANDWMPLIAAGGSLGGFIVLGSIARGVLHATGAEWPTRREKADAAEQIGADAAATAGPAATVAPVSVPAVATSAAPSVSTVGPLTMPVPVQAA